MKLLRLIPADSFFFKGHMMSEMGTPAQWSGLFPPRPNTVYGALRSAYIHRYSDFDAFRCGQDENIKAWMGTPTAFGNFQQAAVFLRQNQQLLLPIPLDYRVFRGAEAAQAEPLTLAVHQAITSTPAQYTLIRKGRAQREGKDLDHSSWLVPIDHWKHAVLHQEPMQHLRPLEQLVDSYMKTGIKIDRSTNQAEDAHFFQMKMLTMKPGCELVSYISEPGPDFSEVPLVSLGSENRPWFLEQEVQEWLFWDKEQMQQIEKMLEANLIARIVLLTPLVLPEDAAFPPDWHNADGNIQLTSEIEVEWLTWASGRPELFGGWDIVAHRPKRRQSMLPAGTVFYVKVKPEDIPTLLRLANGFHLFKEQMPDRCKEGFGYCVIMGTRLV